MENLPPLGALDEAQRIHLINRRTVAWLVEVAALELTVVPIAAALLVMMTGSGDSVGWTVHFIIWAPYLLVRDLLGGTSWGKRMVGLMVVGADGSPPPKVGRSCATYPSRCR